MPQRSAYTKSHDMQASGVQFIQPPNLLRQKVGKGGLPPRVLEQAQTIIRENKIDIRPYLRSQLDALSQALEDAAGAQKPFYLQCRNIRNPLAMLKSHGGMFGYDLISEIAEIGMHLVETTDTLDAHTLNLLDMQLRTMREIVENGIRGDGGEQGYALARRLYEQTLEYRKSGGER